MEINERDLKIISELRNNARAQLTQISKKTKIPISTVYERIKVNSEGVIKKHVSLLDFEKLGFFTRATICLKCSKTSKKELYQKLVETPNLNSLYKINNGYDFMADIIFRNIKDLEEYIERLEEEFTIKSKQVYYIIENIITERFMALKPELVECI